MTKGWVFYAVFSVFFLLISCSAMRNDSQEPDYGQSQLKVSTKYDRDPSTMVDISQAPDLSHEQSAFSLKIFERIRLLHPNDNLMISPLSITMALAMTMNGSGGKTTKSMLSGLGFGQQDLRAVNSYLGYLIKNLSTNDQITLEIANSIWLKENFSPLKRYFYEIVINYFQAGIYPITTVDRINQWCSDKTHEKIRTILNELPPQVALILINAIYFKGSWLEEFNQEKTQKADFNTPAETVQVDMMHKSDEIEYKKGEGYQAVNIPYKDKQTSMYIFLPDNATDLEAFYTGAIDENLFTGFQETKVNLALPRFKFEFDQELEQILRDLGMGIIFSSSTADFTNIAEKQNPCVSQVLHKSYIEVNEEGTEAAAVTVVVMVGAAVSKTVDFTVDRPFFFCIRDNQNNVILFMGHVVDPTKE